MNSSLLQIISIAILLLWDVFLTIVFIYYVKRSRGLTSGIDGKNIVEIVAKQNERMATVVDKLDRVILEASRLKEDAKKNLRKIGVVRFNPFQEVGGDQSFVVSFLDDEGKGIVLSSLHGRGGTRVYAKTIEKGEGKGYTLSTEEKEAIRNAGR